MEDFLQVLDLFGDHSEVQLLGESFVHFDFVLRFECLLLSMV